jgi:hypothetical protein
MLKMNADVKHLSARQREDDRFCTVPVEGESTWDIARTVADIAARRRYGDDGISGFVMQTDTRHFNAVIGKYRFDTGKAILDGVTIAIHLTDSV